MGWQSYIAYFHTSEQYDKIIETIKEHNSSEDYDNIGEELIQVVKCNVISRNHLPNNKCLIFGNGGGRSSTFEFFRRRGIYLESFEKRILNELEDESKWEELKVPLI